MPDIDSGYEMIRKIAEREVEKLHLLEYGRVESVNVHSSEDDKMGYTCGILLVGRSTDDGDMLKLENVPIVTSLMGMVDLPRIDDLVLVSYINGDFELPVIIGRLYSREKLPPIVEEGQYLMEFSPERYDGTGNTPRYIDIKFTDGSQTHITVSNTKLQVNIGDLWLTMTTDEDPNAIRLLTGSQQIEISKDEMISVTSDKDIEITAKGKILIEADGDVEIKGANIHLNK